MSHFTVLVVGENPEKQLQPFHEFECTGDNDEYVQDIDITEDIKKNYASAETSESIEEFTKDFYALKTVKDKCEINVKNRDKHKYGYAIVNEDGSLQKAVRRTNPNSKWDWYELGGRWTRFFKLKKGKVGIQGTPGIMTAEAKDGYADSALKKYIDFDSMAKEAEQKAHKDFDEFEEKSGNQSIIPYSTFYDKNGDHQLAREEYGAQQGVINLRNNDFHFESDYLVGREQFVKERISSSISTFAIVKDGQWYERGDIGWFACVKDEKDQDVWRKEFDDIMNEVHEDTLLSVYDCHI